MIFGCALGQFYCSFRGICPTLKSCFDLSFALTFSKVKIKVDSSAVIKPFGARFANSKKKNIYIYFFRSHPAHTPPYQRHSYRPRRRWRHAPNGKLIWMAAEKKDAEYELCPVQRVLQQVKTSANPPSPHFSTVPGGCTIRRKITRAYLGLSQAHAINAHCAVTVKNEVAVQSGTGWSTSGGRS